jgi:hypothetical protein
VRLLALKHPRVESLAQVARLADEATRDRGRRAEEAGQPILLHRLEGLEGRASRLAQILQRGRAVRVQRAQ